MTAAAKRVATQGNSAKRKSPAKTAPPTEHIDLPKPDDVAKQTKQPYPKGVRIFTYHPEDGSDPIPLAMDGFEQPDKLWHFDTAQLPPLAQTWKWMSKANIPKEIQRRALMLPDAEYFKMFDAWFDAMKAAAKGAVSSAK